MILFIYFVMLLYIYKMQKSHRLLIIILISCLAYIIVIASSCIFYKLHEPKVVKIYITQSAIAAFSEYSYIILLWIGLLAGFVYLRYRANLQRTAQAIQYKNEVQDYRGMRLNTIILQLIWKQRLTIICIVLTVLLIHAYIVIRISQYKNNNLYEYFKNGQVHMNKINHIYTTNYDQSWPGWKYYYGDQYLEQTKDRLERSRTKFMQDAQYSQMLMKLKDLNLGIYALKSWLTNHRFVYAIMRIGFESVGVLVIALMWLVWVFGKLYPCICPHRCCSFFMFIGIWTVVPCFLLASQIIHSIVVLNNHDLCLPQPNSTTFNIVINTDSVNYMIDLKLNVIEDPKSIFKYICQNMQKYHKIPLQNDENIIQHVLNAGFIVFMWAFIWEFLWLIASKGIEDDILLRKSKQISKNKIIFTKNETKYIYVQDQEQSGQKIRSKK